MAVVNTAEAPSIAPRVLVDRLIPGDGLLWDVVRIATANLLLVACAQIALPLPWTPVPITGQTFGVMMVGALLGARRSAIALGLYLLEGAAGLPVFQPFGLPGAARLLGPTAGYLWAFPVAGYVTGWLIERGEDRGLVRLASSFIAGQSLILVGGCAWLAVLNGLDIRAALAAGALPFAPGELIKISLAMAAVRAIGKAARPSK